MRDNTHTLTIQRVEGRKALDRFIRLPWSIYGDDPVWVPPLILERRQHLSPHNPYFEHADFCSWLATRGSRIVGRICAQVDRLYLEHHQNATGFFGMLEAEDDAQVFQLLFETAEGWLAERGMHRVLGPFSLSINDECGLLVEGFKTPPSLMMGHARPYYGPRVEQQDYYREQDLLAYLIEAKFRPPEVMKRPIEKARGRIRLRSLQRSRYEHDLRLLRDIFNDAWSGNWGFVPFTEAEFDKLGRTMRFLIDDEFVQIAEVDGEPAAMIAALPNVNEVIQDLNGRLLPFGWIKLLWRLKLKFPNTARIPLMGVRRRYQNSFLGMALAYLVMDALRAPGVRRGIEEVEMSWILEQNTAMRKVIESLGGVCYKRYRIYAKQLVH